MRWAGADETFLSLDEVAVRSGIPVPLLQAIQREGLLVARVHDGEASWTEADVEVPFAFRFGELDLPHHLVLHLDDPEVVTVHLEDLGDGRTRLDYRSEGLPADEETTIKPGVARMLGYLADFFN